MSGFRFTIPQHIFDGSTYPASDITVIPDKNMSVSNNPRVLTAKFGDGYSQSVEDGINSLESTMQVSFRTRPRSEIDDIQDFFEVQKGYKPFDLTVSHHREGIGGPNEKTIKVKCTQWNMVHNFDEFYTLTAVFERVYTSE